MTLLELRNRIKKKKPKFVRQDSHKRSEVGTRWRSPRGLHSKMRLVKRGYRRKVTKGWGSPKEVKGLHKSGLRFIIINNLNDIQKIDPKADCVVIASNVGQRKRVELLKKLKELKLKVLVFKDIEKYLKGVEEKISLKKKEKEKAAKEKEQKKSEKEKAAEEKGEKTEELDEKIQKEEEEKQKKEQQKILTKRT